MNINKSNAATLELIEVYRTNSGVIFQSDREECWYVHFGGKIARCNYSALFRLKKAIEGVSIEKMLLDPAKGKDFEIISLSGSDHFYVLSAIEILAFKDLLHGAFVMFKLNHLVKDCLCRVI